jgi:hypothetical protein
LVISPTRNIWVPSWKSHAATFLQSGDNGVGAVVVQLERRE